MRADRRRSKTRSIRVRVTMGCRVGRWSAASCPGLVPISNRRGILGPQRRPYARRLAGSTRRDHRRGAHPLCPRLWRLRHGRQPGHADARPSGRWSSASSSPASTWAMSSPGRSSSTPGTTTWCAKACCPRAWRPRPRAGHPARLRHQPGSGDPGRQQDRAGTDGCRHRRGRGFDQRSAHRLSALLSAAAVAQLHGSLGHGPDQTLLRPAPAPLQAGDAGRRGAAHRPEHGPEHGTDRPEMAYHPRRAGRAGLRKPSQGGGGLEGRLLRGSGGAVPRARGRQQRARGHQRGEAGEAAAGFRSDRRRHADRRQQHPADRRRQRRTAGLRGVGPPARPAGAGLPVLRQGLGGGFRRPAPRGC